MTKFVGVMCVIAAFGSLAGCNKSEGDDDANNTGGSGGALAGTGGVLAGTGGALAGSGGVAAAGSGGAAGAGSGGAGVAGMSGGNASCAGADTSAGGPALHAAAAEVLTAGSPCGFTGCHVGTTAAAMLTLMGSADLHATLVGKLSCEAPNMPLIDGSGGDAALKNSWLWTKLTAPATDTAGITEEATFGTPGVCGQMSGQKYGVRMPATTPAAETISEERLTKIRNWICGGAPGPT